MQAKQLKADLSMISDAVKRADVPDAAKSLFREMIAWNEAMVDHAANIHDRMEEAEAALDEILDGEGELLSAESATSIFSALEHSALLCAATLALLEGPMASTVDEVTKKRFGQLIENAQRAIALANQTVTELTANETEENADADDGAGDGDGRGDGEPAADDEVDEEGEAS